MRINGGIEILVDFNAFRRDLNEIILRKIINESDNSYLSLLCAEYDIYSDAYVDFHNCFAEIGVKLVWIVDSVKGIDLTVSAQKTDTWIYRTNQTIGRTDNLMENCKNKVPKENLENIFPPYSFPTTVKSLKNSGAEVIQLLIGGSDEFIVSEFHRRKSYAIITGDTDFLIFPDCTIIFPRILFTIYGDQLTLPFIDNDNPGKIFKKPTRFLCPIVTQRRVIQLLQLGNKEQLIVLGIIKGTDNTLDYFQDLQYHLNIIQNPENFSHVTQVARYITTNNITTENIFQIRQIIEFLNHNPNVRDSMEFSLNFYSLRHFNDRYGDLMIQFDPNVATNSLTDYFRRKLSNNEIVSEIYACHLGKFGAPIIPEKLDESCSSIVSILFAIRSRIYPYVLINKENQIFESNYRISPEFFEIDIEHAPIKTNQIIGKPNSESERQDGVVYGIDLFEEIWSHLEDGESLNFMRTFGLEIGFICYILRYFYKITHDINMRLSDEEFKALFAAVFYKYGVSQKISFRTRLSRDTFMGMKVCPSERCLMIFSWFVEVYFYGKYLCGNAFNITEYFPSIETLFSSSVFIGFYENIMNDRNGRLSHLEESIHDSITVLQEQVLMHFREEFDIIAQ